MPVIRRPLPTHSSPHFFPAGRRTPWLAALAALVVAAVVVWALSSTATPGTSHAARAAGARGDARPSHSSSGTSVSAATRARTAGARKPNIVFVLTDDLSMDLVRFMPEVEALRTRGMSFKDYFVSDSLCCPSRSSIFTGDFPHDTGVFTNAGGDGGINAFFNHGDENHTFNLALQQAGYRTAMMGKYLNGYLQGPNRSSLPGTYVPAGWNEWDVAGWGYPEFNYPMNENGRIVHFGHKPRAYLTDVLARRGVAFINRSASAHKPFFLELATFAPHTPYTPAPRDAGLFPGLTAPRPASFDQLPANPPSWLAGHPPLSPGQIARINRVFRRRAQSVQAVDDMIASVETTLAKRHLLNNTYIVFSSDNGLHTGEYRLMPGKLTAFDTDIHVPLIVAGPGIPADSSSDSIVQNTDLASTFAALGGTSMSNDGHSLLPLLRGGLPTDWRTAALVEHHGPATDPNDPDAQTSADGNPTTYEAMRTADYLYVEYADGEREFYDLRTDPDELDNIAGSLSSGQLSDLHQALTQLENCHGSSSCWAASHVNAMPSG